MTFAAASLAQLATLFAGLAAVVTLLYLLKLRRRRVQVAWSRLWREVLGERESTSLLRKLKRLLSLLLQLVLLALLVMALGDPRLAADEKRARTMLILVEAGASMQAVEGGRTRLARAGDEARRLVRGLSGHDLAMVVQMDAGVRPLSPFDSDEKVLLAAIDELSASDTAVDLTAALRFAADALRGHANPMLVVVGDGLFPEQATTAVILGPPPGGQRTHGEEERERLDAADLRGIDVRFVPVGVAGDNVAVTAFTVRRYPANRQRYEIFLEVANHGQREARRRLEIRSGDEIIDSEQLTIAAGGQLRRFFPNLTGEGERLQARLTAPGQPAPTSAAAAPSDPSAVAAGAGAGDARRGAAANRLGDAGRAAGATDAVAALDVLALDDRAYAVLPPRQKLGVLLVSPGNLFLEGALLLDENLDVRRIIPAEYARAEAAGDVRRADAVIFDAFSPEKPPPAGNFLYLDPRGPGSPLAVAGELRAPIITEIARDHPVMRFLSLTDVNIASASRFVLEPGDVALASALRQPLIVARNRDRLRLVALGFDVRRSDLPMRVAFPMLLVNTLEWFAGDSGNREAAGQLTGRSLRIPVTTGSDGSSETGAQSAGATAAPTEATVTDPGGRQRRVPIHDGEALLDAGRAGFYTLRSGEDGDSIVVAVNLDAAATSDLRRPATLRLAGQEIGRPPPSALGLRRGIWVYLVLAACLLSLIEWFTYNRRMTV